MSIVNTQKYNVLAKQIMLAQDTYDYMEFTKYLEKIEKAFSDFSALGSSGATADGGNVADSTLPGTFEVAAGEDARQRLIQLWQIQQFEKTGVVPDVPDAMLTGEIKDPAIFANTWLDSFYAGVWAGMRGWGGLREIVSMADYDRLKALAKSMGRAGAGGTDLDGDGGYGISNFFWKWDAKSNKLVRNRTVEAAYADDVKQYRYQLASAPLSIIDAIRMQIELDPEGKDTQAVQAIYWAQFITESMFGVSQSINYFQSRSAAAAANAAGNADARPSLAVNGVSGVVSYLALGAIFAAIIVAKAQEDKSNYTTLDRVNEAFTYLYGSFSLTRTVFGLLDVGAQANGVALSNSVNSAWNKMAGLAAAFTMVRSIISMVQFMNPEDESAPKPDAGMTAAVWAQFGVQVVSAMGLAFGAPALLNVALTIAGMSDFSQAAAIPIYNEKADFFAKRYQTTNALVDKALEKLFRAKADDALMNAIPVMNIFYSVFGRDPDSSDLYKEMIARNLSKDELAEYNMLRLSSIAGTEQQKARLDALETKAAEVYWREASLSRFTEADTICGYSASVLEMKAATGADHAVGIVTQLVTDDMATAASFLGGKVIATMKSGQNFTVSTSDGKTATTSALTYQDGRYQLSGGSDTDMTVHISFLQPFLNVEEEVRTRVGSGKHAKSKIDTAAMPKSTIINGTVKDETLSNLYMLAGPVEKSGLVGSGGGYEFYMGAGSDRVYAGPRATFIDGGVGVSLKTNVEMDIVDYGQAFVFGSNLNAQNGGNFGSITVTGRGTGSYEVYKAGTSVFFDTSIASAKAFKRSTAVEYRTYTRTTSAFNNTDILNNVEGIVGSIFGDRFIGGSGRDIFAGSGGNDLFTNISGDTIACGEGNDSVQGLASGGAVGSLVDGDTGNDVLSLGDGNDTLIGGAGNDTILGGGGGDIIAGDFSSEDENKAAASLAYADVINGGDGDDTIFGNVGADKLSGDAGDDGLVGGVGNDTLSGGEGVDQLLGEDGNDSLMGDNGDDTLWGGAGADTLSGGGGKDYLLGGDGIDSLYGGLGDDYLYGEAGDDQLVGEAGNDVLVGGAGIDRINGGDGDDTLVGGAGDDILSGGAGDDFLYDEAGKNGMAGDDGMDILVVGDSTLENGSTFNGGAGMDVFSGRQLSRGMGASLTTGIISQRGRIWLEGQEAAGSLLVQIENLEGSSYDDSLTGDAARNMLIGRGGDDILRGMAGDDVLHGGTGDDMLEGGLGHDLLIGGEGNDVLFGGEGADTYIFQQQTGYDTLQTTSAATAARELNGDVLYFTDVDYRDLIMAVSDNGDLMVRKYPSGLSSNNFYDTSGEGAVLVKNYRTDKGDANIALVAKTSTGQAILSGSMLTALAAEMSVAFSVSNSSINDLIPDINFAALETPMNNLWTLQRAA